MRDLISRNLHHKSKQGNARNTFFVVPDVAGLGKRVHKNL